MSMPVRLILPLPPTINTYWRHVGKKVLVSEQGRAFRKRCELAAIAQRATPVEGEVRIAGTVYMGRAGCDLDNRIKPLLDALQGIAYKNDAQVAHIDLRRAVDTGSPRVEITVEPLERAA